MVQNRIELGSRRRGAAGEAKKEEDVGSIRWSWSDKTQRRGMGGRRWSSRILMPRTRTTWQGSIETNSEANAAPKYAWETIKENGKDE